MGVFLQALGLEAVADGTGDYSPQITPPTWGERGVSNPRQSLAIPSVLRAVQILAGMGSQLRCQSWRGSSLVAPTPSLVAQPDPWRSWRSWAERVIVCLALEGNAFLRVRRSGGGEVIGEVVALEVLNPYRVAVRHSRGTKSYTLTTDTGEETLSSADVIHIWGLEVPGLDRGLSPIGWCKATLTGIADVRDYSQSWFAGGAVDGVLSTDQRLNKGDADRYRQTWYDAGKDRVGPAIRVLGQGLEYEPITLKPSEAQWLEAQGAGVLEIARMFGMPADYLLASVEGASLTYRTLEMIDTSFLRLTLFPQYLAKIEAALTQVLPRGQEARFELSQMLRPDAKTRAEINKLYINAGVLHPREARISEGLDPDNTPTNPTTQKAPA